MNWEAVERRELRPPIPARPRQRDVSSESVYGSAEGEEGGLVQGWSFVSPAADVE